MRRAAAVLLVAAGLVAGPAPAALAEAPEKTGWWSAASGGGLALPQPTAAEGDLRVARTVRTEAFAAVLVRADGATSAELTLGLREGRTIGTPDVVACPTAGTDWQEGGNQPVDAAPAVDCGALSLASSSEDGRSLVFGLDATQQVEPGVWSVALLPQPGVTTPFSVDLVVPDDGGVTVLQSAPADDAEPAVEDTAASEPAATGTAEQPSGFTADSAAPVLDVPAPAGEGVAVNPLLAEPLTSAVEPEAEPPLVDLQVAPPQGASTPRLAAAQDATGLDGPRLLALLALVAVAYLVGRAQGEQRPGPRLLGGRARVAQVVAPAAAAPEPAERPRGIGRFAKQRDHAPRRLR